MSIVTNNQVQQGDKITSSDLNSSFTDLNNGFPMDGVNFGRNSFDSAHFSGSFSDGESGLVLVNITKSNSYQQHIIPDWQIGDTIFKQVLINLNFSTPKTISQNDIIRTYWNLLAYTNSTTLNSAPFTSETGSLCWVVWLEWDIGNGFVAVPDQSHMQTTISNVYHGGRFDSLHACTLIQHAFIYEGIGNAVEIETRNGNESFYGSWFYKADQTITLQGLRLVGRGLFYPNYTGNPVENYLMIAPSSGAHECQVNQSELIFMLLRND
jgi:hypothetical protein